MKLRAISGRQRCLIDWEVDLDAGLVTRIEASCNIAHSRVADAAGSCDITIPQQAGRAETLALALTRTTLAAGAAWRYLADLSLHELQAMDKRMRDSGITTN